jgi:hypothetical protein
MLTLVLLLISFVCLLLAALNVAISPRINLLAAGLAFFVLAQFIPVFTTLAK